MWASSCVNPRTRISPCSVPERSYLVVVVVVVVMGGDLWVGLYKVGRGLAVVEDATFPLS